MTSPFDKYVSGKKLTLDEINALNDPEEAYALGYAQGQAKAYEECAKIADECNEPGVSTIIRKEAEKLK